MVSSFEKSYFTKNEFLNKDIFSKCDRIRSFLWIWLHLLKKSLMENFIFLGSVMIILLAQIHFSIYPRNENIYVLLISTLAIT